MGFLDLIAGHKPKSVDGTRLVPCILCGKEIPVRRGSLNNKFFYPLGGRHYACCSNCEGRGRIEPNKIWSRIAAIPESKRQLSDLSDIS
jgi:hypothetical protein